MQVLYRLPSSRPGEPSGGLLGTPKDVLKDQDLRMFLKYPLGILVAHDPDESALVLKKIASVLDVKEILTVGDYVTYTLLKHGVDLKLAVIDGKVMRAKWSRVKPKKFIKTVNLPGTITKEAWAALSDALSEGVRFVFVDGEEDLLVLPLILMVGDKDLVVYGQPGLGMVLVLCDKSKKEIVERVLELMRVGRDDRV